MLRGMRKIALLCVMFTGAYALSASAIAPQTPSRNDPAQRLTLDGVENFARIDGVLYRGAQPEDYAYNELRNVGIAVVVDFRHSEDEIASEKRAVEANGMRFVSLPWTSRRGPIHDQVLAFLNLMRENPGKKIFVHCARGADRTGLMVALYRITFDHWSVDEALEEMKSFHHHTLLLSNLDRYVREYPSELSTDPALRAIVQSRSAPDQP
jgi:tyrosine-protein phosphatase SIW14